MGGATVAVWFVCQVTENQLIDLCRRRVIAPLMRQLFYGRMNGMEPGR